MRTIKVEVWDDRDHSVLATQTRTVGIDGVWYETDLGDENAKLLDESLAWVRDHGRRIGGHARSTAIRDTQTAPSLSAPKSTGDKPPDAPSVLTARRKRNRRIREWARETNDPDIGESFERGYIPVDMRERYNGAHPEDRDPAALAGT